MKRRKCCPGCRELRRELKKVRRSLAGLDEFAHVQTLISSVLIDWVLSQDESDQPEADQSGKKKKTPRTARTSAARKPGGTDNTRRKETT